MDAIRGQGLKGEIVYACGPTYAAGLKGYGEEMKSPLLDFPGGADGLRHRRLPGLCLQSKEIDGHSHVHNKRICKDGPVFFGR